MRSSLFARVCSLCMVPTGLLLSATQATADPFAAEYTVRESKRVSAIATAAPFTRTYTVLAQDSKDLTFYESPTGKLFIAFASKDASLDDLGANQCGPSAYYQIYWADKSKDLPAVCVSTSYSGGGGNNHSVEPFIAGSDDDEGRYVAYETDATNVIFFVPTETPTPTPATPPAEPPVSIPMLRKIT